MDTPYSRLALRVAMVALASGIIVSGLLNTSATGNGTNSAPASANSNGDAGGGLRYGYPPPPGDNDPGSNVKTLSRAAEAAINVCDYRDPRCIADVLDNFA